MLINLAWKSLLSRKTSVILIVFAMSLSLCALLLTRSLSDELENGFNNSVSSTDLIIAARSHPIQVLLYSVFRLGSATQAVSWKRYQELKTLPEVKWTFPIALGDSHRGLPVIGTDLSYFKHFKYAQKRPLALAEGELFDAPDEVVIGSAVAREHGYKVGKKIFLSHGVSGTSFVEHRESKFRIVGILKPTGTPVDRSIHIDLRALEALHLPQWKFRLAEVSLEQLPYPTKISAVFVGLKSRFMTFAVQGKLNSPNTEPLSAIIPGVALSELWHIMDSAEMLLNVLTWIMLITSLVATMAMLQSTILARMPEIALLRMIGATPLSVFFLIQLEMLLLMAFSWILAISLSLGAQLIAKQPLADYFGVFIQVSLPVSDTLIFAAASFGLAILVGLLPAFSAFKMSLNRSLLDN